jgi:hypothetical protein
MHQSAGLRLAMLLAAALTFAVSPGRAADAGKPDPASNPATQAAAREEGTRAAESETPPPSRRRDTYPFRGVIAEVDAKAGKVELRGRQTRRVLLLTKTTRIEKGGAPALLEDLEPGERVGGTLRRNAQGAEELVLLRVAMAGSEEKPDPAPEAGAGADSPGKEARN